MPSRTNRIFMSLFILSLPLGAVPAGAQGIMGRIKDKAKSAIEKKAAGAVSCAISDQTCIDKAKADGKPVVVTDKDGKPASSADSARAMSGTPASADAASSTAGSAKSGSSPSAASAPPGAGVWLNYDFVPGDSVLFYDDFATDHVGDLPTHEDVTHGNMTVVETGGRKFLRTETGGDVTITLPRALPQRFTIETVFHRRGGNGMGLYFRIGSDDQELSLRCDQGNATIYGHGPAGSKESGQSVEGMNEDAFQTCRFMIDSGYVKAYVDSVRVGQLNNLTFAHPNKIQLEVPNANENGTLITEIRIAEGGRPLYDALAAKGRVSTHGILFDTGSDHIRGESTPTLTQIADMLKAHPDLKLTIEGHTDNVGKAADNQTLSEKRAAAVKQYLVTTAGIDASRLATKGLGDTKPVASNQSPEGRQQNRRVELVKM
jgi:outer membrane protein OmpA-like peptidoglycan-associated protein